MKYSPMRLVAGWWTLLLACSLHLLGQEMPDSRGKIVLVLDKALSEDSVAGASIQRLQRDLTGDGWRVLRHDIERGPEAGGSGDGAYERWVTENAWRVREVRALIKADYDAAKSGPTHGEVKAVLILGHVPVPYSGDSAAITGQHVNWQGAHPADSFYGEMTGQYGVGGWSDLVIDNLPPFIGNSTNRQWADWRSNGASSWPGRNEIVNRPGDGKFDQNRLPNPMVLAVGRVDLSSMPAFGESEVTLLARYLDKNHDFRNGILTVQRRAWLAEWQTEFEPFQVTRKGIGHIFGTNSIFGAHDTALHWFPDVQTEGQDYLFGYGGGYGSGNSAQGIGATSAAYGYDEPGILAAFNNFVDFDSRVVFLNLYSSICGDWDQKDILLKAPLANRYSPPQRHGFGLTVVWGNWGLDEASSIQRAMGVPYGESLCNGFSGDVHNALMGDPTLRMQIVQPPSELTAIQTDGNYCFLTWKNSIDADVAGYNIYRAPTLNGPFALVQTNDAAAVQCEVIRPSGDEPDNYYMVRAVKAETTPTGSYLNISEGCVAALSSALPFIRIMQDPASQSAVSDTYDGVTNTVAFTVDAVGINADFDEKLAFQWNKDGVPLSDSDGADGFHIQGATSRALIIKGVRSPDDAGRYFVVVSLAGTSISTTSSVATLTVSPGLPTVAPITLTIDEGQPVDIDVLSSCNSPFKGASGVHWKILGIGCPSMPDSVLPQNGTAEIQSTNARQWIRYTPNPGYFSPEGAPDSFQFVVSDGFGSARGIVQIATRDASVAKNLTRYGLTGNAMGTWTYAKGQFFKPEGNSRELRDGDFELNLTRALPADKGDASGYLEGSLMRGNFERTINIADLDSTDGAAGLILRQHVDPPMGSGGKDGMFDLFVFIGVARTFGRADPGFYCAAQIKSPAAVNGWWDTPHFWIPAPVALPHAWVKMSRDGNQITASVSSDGRSWANTGVFYIPSLSEEIELGYYVHQGQYGEIGRALFRPLKLSDAKVLDDRWSFKLTGPANIGCQVESSQDWIRWNRVATASLSPIEGAADFGEANFSIPAGQSNTFFRASFGDYRSVNALGFMSQTLSSRESVVLNPLNTPNNHLTDLFSSLPDGSSVTPYTAIGLIKSAAKIQGNWEPSDWMLNGGDAVLLTLPADAVLPVSIAFCGEVVQPGLETTIPPGAPIWSSPAPQVNGMEPPDNLIAPVNGGRLVSFTSEHNAAWGAQKLTDGAKSGPGASWASATRDEVGADLGPQAFVYGFSENRLAELNGIVIYNYGEKGAFYSRSFEVFTSLDLRTWTLQLRGELEAREGPQLFFLNNSTGRFVKLVVQSGYDSYCWQLGELVVRGKLLLDNLLLPANGGVLLNSPSQLNEDWGASKLTDGVDSGEGFSWASPADPGPQSFIYSFSDNRIAELEAMTIYNYGGSNAAFSYGYSVYTSLDASSWYMRATGKLLPQEGPQRIPLRGVLSRYVKLVVLSGYIPANWNLGEVEVTGTFDVKWPDNTGYSGANEAAYASLDSAKPNKKINLAPCMPTGWTDKLRVATSRGEVFDTAWLTPSNQIYVSWAVMNNGDMATAVPFYVDLSVDEKLLASWNFDVSLASGGILHLDSYGLGALSAGTHTIKVKAASLYAMFENPGVANEYTKSITIQGPPLLYTVTPSAGINGSILPNRAVTWSSARSIHFTAAPEDGFSVDQWFVNGLPVQNGGADLLLDNITKDTNVRVTFTALPRILFLSGNLAFGDVTTNTTALAVLSMVNGGNTSLTVSNISYPDGFTGNWAGAIAAGETQQVAVAFTPAAVTNYGGLLTVESDATLGSSVIDVSGTGTVASTTSLLKLVGVNNGQYRFRLSGLTGTSYVIQTSTNLVHWLNLKTNATSGIITLMTMDSKTNVLERKFFRAVPAD